jgi:L-ascorbate metabolism protein UlaG (beta-lactamase superfamily)
LVLLHDGYETIAEPGRRRASMLQPITWFRQAALRWTDGQRTVYLDPWGTTAEDAPADLILITHAHSDHFKPDEIDRLASSGAAIAAPQDVAAELTGDVTPVVPGESYELAGVRFTTVPAYNTREEALEFHPKRNRWLGYVVELGGHTYYHAGDTDHAAELDDVAADVAFLPIGGHFTMDAEEAAVLAKAISPQIAVPIHYGFIVGSASDGERFRRAADPVKVELLEPRDAFERA